jgi:hypothetical protein
MKSKNPRMFSGTARYNKFDVGVGQIETAIRLFITDGCDMFSAITLAGCAGEIFHHLVVRAGKKPFVDNIAKIEQKHNPSHTPSRSKIIKHINATLFINEVKHFDDQNDEFIEFDAEECATGAILKAIADWRRGWDRAYDQLIKRRLFRIAYFLFRSHELCHKTLRYGHIVAGSDPWRQSRARSAPQ